MGRQSSQIKRVKLVEAADSLVYSQGFHGTTLADVAKAAGVPLGNVYYYFKTKDELGAAVIDRRADGYKVLIGEWDRQVDPKARIKAFLDYVVRQRDMLSRSGCPTGSLCQELRKEGGVLAEHAAILFRNMLGWLEIQFQAIGHGEDAADLALHLVSALQGVSLLTHTFQNPDLMLRECVRLKEWIETL